MTPTPDITLESTELRVRCTPAQGFSIASLVDVASGAEALWQRTGHTPAPCSRALGPAGVASETSFLDVFAGGWFEMFPEVGYTQPDDPTSLLHGEVVRLPWEVVDVGKRHVEARVATVRRPLVLTRRLTLDGGELRVWERIENVSGAPVPYTWGHHPCFSRATFAGGRIELEVAAAEVPDPWFDPAHARLALGRFDWPNAPARERAAADLAPVRDRAEAAATADRALENQRSEAADPAPAIDLSRVPASADGRHDHACLRMAGGSVRLTAPGAGAHGRALRIAFDHTQFPHVLFWQNHGAGDGFPMWGGSDTFAIEFSTIPGRSTPDALAAGAVSTLAPGEVVETAFTVAWEAI
jgi:galactose mutarotase-like enzyme